MAPRHGGGMSGKVAGPAGKTGLPIGAWDWEGPPLRHLCMEIDGKQIPAEDLGFQVMLQRVAGASIEDLGYDVMDPIDRKLAAQQAFSRRPLSAGAPGTARAQDSYSARSFGAREARPTSARRPPVSLDRSAAAASRAARSASAARVAAHRAAEAAQVVTGGGHMPYMGHCSCGPDHDCTALRRGQCYDWARCCPARHNCWATGRGCACGACPCHGPRYRRGIYRSSYASDACVGASTPCGRCSTVGWNPHTGWCRCGFRNAPPCCWR
uniref:Uncharacterized protein n=1 Tax=Alexandrium monilatum TaxID=311494 RepID=A0A7S4UYQ3_9DINO